MKEDVKWDSSSPIGKNFPRARQEFSKNVPSIAGRHGVGRGIRRTHHHTKNDKEGGEVGEGVVTIIV